MAKNCMIRREKKRMNAQRREQRAALTKQLKDPSIDIETKEEIYAKLRKMPKDSSYVRLTRRCEITGRPRGVYRKFKLCRNKLREHAMAGEIPGLVMSSW